MGKKLKCTPRSQIRSAIRKVCLRSRERQAALKRDNYTCQICKRKQSRAKGKEFSVEVHHIDGIPNMEEVVDAFYKYILCHPDNLLTLCKDCHAEKQEE